MRSNTQFGKVVSSHSSAWGASSFVQKLRIDSRSASCSSVKMKWRFLESKSGLRTFSAAGAMAGGDLPRWSGGPPGRSRLGGGRKKGPGPLSAGGGGGGGPPGRRRLGGQKKEGPRLLSGGGGGGGGGEGRAGSGRARAARERARGLGRSARAREGRGRPRLGSGLRRRAGWRGHARP